MIDTEQKMIAVIEAETENFVALIELAGLDKKHAFRHADLRDVDFSDCDLRGFDFTGADLSGSRGENVLMDETTVLVDADVRNSIFEAKA